MGKTVDVYFVHFDRVGSTAPAPAIYLSETATLFDYAILYAMRSNTQLQAFDSIAIGAGSGLTYPALSGSGSSSHAWRGHLGAGDAFSGLGTVTANCSGSA